MNPYTTAVSQSVRTLEPARSKARPAAGALIALLTWLSPGLMANSSSSPNTQLALGYTGAPGDHGDCSACHNTSAPNSDSRGSVTLSVTSYNPGVMQIVRVTVKHPTATRWGFQLTAREVSNQTINAGTFTAAGKNVEVRCADGSQFGSPVPCSATGQVEYAEHVNAPSTSAGMGFEFDVNWSPPSPEVGKVTFYVSAVAADGDGTPANDHVYTIAQTIEFSGGCPDTKKPTLTTAENAASRQPGISSNALISITGLGFTDAGTKRTVGLGDLVNGAFPTVLSCVAVEMNGPGLSNFVRLPLLYVQQDQINAQAPRFTGTGPVNVRVILNPDKPNQLVSDVGTLNTLQNFAPAFFVFDNSMNSIAAVFPDGTLLIDPSLIASGKRAHGGDVVILYGTGFGDSNPSVAAGSPAPGMPVPLTNPITVTIGGTTLASNDVLYAGLTPFLISGLYQFNVRIPASVASGNVPVVISIGGQQTQAGTTIPIQ